MMALDKLKVWLKQNVIVVSIVLVCLLLRYAWQGALGLKGLPEVVFLLSLMTLMISTQLKNQTERLMLGIVYSCLTFLPYLGVVPAFALLIFFAFLLEMHEGIFFFVIIFLFLSVNEVVGNSGLIDRYSAVIHWLQVINLGLIFFLIVKVSFNPLYLVSFFLLLMGGALKFSGASIYVYALVFMGLSYAIYRGVIWGTTLTTLLLAFYWGDQGLLFAGLVALSLMSFFKASKVMDICQLILIMGLFQKSAWVGYLFFAVFLIKLAANNRVKTCLMKSHLS